VRQQEYPGKTSTKSTSALSLEVGFEVVYAALLRVAIRLLPAFWRFQPRETAESCIVYRAMATASNIQIPEHLGEKGKTYGTAGEEGESPSYYARFQVNAKGRWLSTNP
jgi:hypothetical protein